MTHEPNLRVAGWALVIWTLLLGLVLVSCKAESPAPAHSSPPADTPTSGTGRIVAIGDLHGDLAALRRTFVLAGAIDADDQWVGNTLTVVLTGDFLDRGDDDRAICDLLETLALRAREQGGRLVALNGNHEIMNVMGDMRYVTPAAFEAFAEFAPPIELISPRQDTPAYAYGRLYAFSPGGPYAQKLAANGVVEVIDGTVFVHGALLPAVVEYGLERLNNETRTWLRGEGELPALLATEEGPIWSSMFSDEPVETSCAILQTTLRSLGARRLVVGHRMPLGLVGIHSDCDKTIWQIDVGLSAFYKGPTEILEIVDGRTQILSL